MALRTAPAPPGSSLASRPAPAIPELRERPADLFRDLPRHFVFEYYPWYDAASYRHWDQWERVPPHDLASNYVPRLGAYDSLSTAVIEQHARWIAASGAGAVNLSWWGPGSWEDRSVPVVMDVMRAHDIKVAFHIEPYSDDRSRSFAEDVMYLLREYGDRRRYDALLLLENADGRRGPVFKGFRCILPPEFTDCHGVTRPVSDYTADAEWRFQTDSVRSELRRDFDHVTLLADSLDFGRTPAAGFDGIAVYDNFVPPESYRALALGASAAGLTFSFNVNPGYDTIEPRTIEPGSCYAPTPFAPPAPAIDWTRPDERERAAALAQGRVVDSFRATLDAQSEPGLSNASRGFFLVYLTSFNEWHEGHAFEPMKDAAELSADERRFGYHNPARGDTRLAALGGLLREALQPSEIRATA
jgi:hypothetical protein